jgi:GT2 family glycosyltransferase
MTEHNDPAVVVSIINYRTAQMTIDCARSVLAAFAGTQGTPHDGRIVIVDNRSDDGSVEQLEAWMATLPSGSPVDLVASPTNSGFSGGHNQGMGAQRAEYYLVLNSDALIRPDFFDQLMPVVRAQPKTGLFAPRIEYDEGGVQNTAFRFHSPQSELIRAGRNRLITRAFRHHEVTIGPDPDPAAIEWASFACILLRGEMVRALGPMDEGYFLYYEDAEYCLRARRAGWQIAYIPEAIAIHFRGGSGPVKTLQKERAELPAYFYSSRTRFLYQAHGRAGLLAANLAWYAGAGLRSLQRLVRRSIPQLPKREARNIWTNFTNPLGPDRRPGRRPDPSVPETGGPAA